jgi:hypothetical protein
LLFTVKMADGTIQAEGLTHGSALAKYLTSSRTLFSARDPTRVDDLFASLPKKAVVRGGGNSKSHEITWEKLGKKAAPEPEMSSRSKSRVWGASSGAQGWGLSTPRYIVQDR